MLRYNFLQFKEILGECFGPTLTFFKFELAVNKLTNKLNAGYIVSSNFSIYLINKDLLFMLLERINHWHDQQCMGDIFLDQVSGIKLSYKLQELQNPAARVLTFSSYDAYATHPIASLSCKNLNTQCETQKALMV